MELEVGWFSLMLISSSVKGLFHRDAMNLHVKLP